MSSLSHGLTAAVVSVVLALSAAAAPMLDQQYTAPSDNIGPTPWGLPVDWAQTFTVGITGVLDSVTVKGGRANLPVEPLLIDVRTTVAGVPTESNIGGNILGSVVLAPVNVPPAYGDIVADLSGLAINVSVGDVLAIVVRSATGSSADPGYYELRGRAPGGYDGGGAFVRIGEGDTWHPYASFPTLDIAFSTYVNPVPEPGSSVILAATALALTMPRPRRHRLSRRA